jgi:hypothetical protein
MQERRLAGLADIDRNKKLAEHKGNRGKISTVSNAYPTATLINAT